MAMNCAYEDIRSRITDPILWWDEQGVPRYEEFHPRRIANIYAKEATLLQIECQGCHREFRVCVSSSLIDEIARHQKQKTVYLYELIKDKTIHYGDPPNIYCCAAGPMMNCIDRRVLEYWKNDREQGWLRDPQFEVELDTE